MQVQGSNTSSPLAAYFAEQMPRGICCTSAGHALLK